MYPEQFWLLKKGDVIKMAKSGVHRKILAISSNNGKDTTFITLKKIAPSWTRHDYTIYCSNEAQNFLPVKVKNTKIWKLKKDMIIERRKAIIKQYIRDEIERLEGRLACLKAKRV